MQSNLALLEELKYRAPLNHFDPRSYPAYYEKQKFPLAYLEAVGIETICDLILNQFSPKQVAILLQISQVILMKWIDADPDRRKEWEWALNYEADNQMFEARDKLRDAKNKTQLEKADKEAGHLRYMAKGFGSKRWGQKVDVNANIAATVSYAFNVALTPDQEMKTVESRKQAAIEAQPEKMVDFNELLGAGLNVVDLTIPEEEDISRAEAKGIESVE